MEGFEEYWESVGGMEWTKETARRTWQAATERAAGIAYKRLMTMGYQMRADDVRDAIREG